MMQAGMNQMKDQAKSLIPSEMQDKNEQGSSPKVGAGDVRKKPKKKSVITRSLAIRMYTVLLFHTLIITILVFLFYKGDPQQRIVPRASIILLSNSSDSSSDPSQNSTDPPKNSTDPNSTIPDSEPSQSTEPDLWLHKLIIFGICFGGSLFLSLCISKIKFFTRIYLHYILYLVLLAANIAEFVCLANLSESLYELVTTMFIIFDAGSLTIIIFSGFVKDTPSTFWLMCSSAGGCFIALIVMSKIYSGSLFRYFVMLFGILAFGIYETMNYKALDTYKQNVKSSPSAPSSFSLPFELNISFVRVVWYLVKGICSLFSLCCCPNKKRK
jgi:hypothetical protein